MTTTPCFSWRTWLLGSALGLAALLPARAMDVSGVEVKEHLVLGADELTLNGAGMRAVAMFRAYVIGLYLPHKGADVASVLSMEGRKRVHLILMRDLHGVDLGKGLGQSVRENVAPADWAGLSERVALLQSGMKTLGEVPKGATIELDYEPGEGTQVLINGRSLVGHIPGDDFYRALLLIWLGDHPVGEYLKRQLLGAAS